MASAIKVNVRAPVAPEVVVRNPAREETVNRNITSPTYNDITGTVFTVIKLQKGRK
jgi:hypothetical protein